MHIKVGYKNNRLTAKSYSHTGKHGRRYFLFLCDCGNEKLITAEAVISGNTKSCGCLAREKKKSKRISPNHSEITAIILGYKRHAIDRGYKWNLTRQEVEAIVSLNCHYCGIEPSNTKKTKNSIGNGMKYSGIDRIDSSKDYEPTNVVAACKLCNYAKSNLSIDEFKEWAKRLNSMANQWDFSVDKEHGF